MIGWFSFGIGKYASSSSSVSGGGGRGGAVFIGRGGRGGAWSGTKCAASRTAIRAQQTRAETSQTGGTGKVPLLDLVPLPRLDDPHFTGQRPVILDNTFDQNKDNM